MFLPLSHAEKQLSDPTQRIHKVLETARILYGLIHARYVLTAQGLTDMVRRLAWCWLCTCVHARVFFRSRSRSLSLSPRSLLLALSLSLSLAASLVHSTCHSALSRTQQPSPSTLPRAPPPLAPPSLYSSSSVTTSHRAATKVKPVRSSFNLPIANGRPRTDARRKPNTRLTSSARARVRSARSRQYFRRGCLTRHR